MSIRIKEMERHVLLKKVLLYEHNIKDYTLAYNENGKPYLLNMDKNVHFNLSSSKNISAVVIASTEVGICIKHFFYNNKILDLCFNEKEKNIIENSSKKEYDFTRIYTLKLAYIKMLGLNKEYPLIKINTLKLKNWRTIENKNFFVSVIKNNKNCCTSRRTTII